MMKVPHLIHVVVVLVTTLVLSLPSPSAAECLDWGSCGTSSSGFDCSSTMNGYCCCNTNGLYCKTEADCPGSGPSPGPQPAPGPSPGPAPAPGPAPTPAPLECPSVVHSTNEAEEVCSERGASIASVGTTNGIGSFSCSDGCSGDIKPPSPPPRPPGYDSTCKVTYSAVCDDLEQLCKDQYAGHLTDATATSTDGGTYSCQQCEGGVVRPASEDDTVDKTVTMKERLTFSAIGVAGGVVMFTVAVLLGRCCLPSTDDPNEEMTNTGIQAGDLSSVGALIQMGMGILDEKTGAVFTLTNYWKRNHQIISLWHGDLDELSSNGRLANLLSNILSTLANSIALGAITASASVIASCSYSWSPDGNSSSSSSTSSDGASGSKVQFQYIDTVLTMIISAVWVAGSNQLLTTTNNSVVIAGMARLFVVVASIAFVGFAVFEEQKETENSDIPSDQLISLYVQIWLSSLTAGWIVWDNGMIFGKWLAGYYYFKRYSKEGEQVASKKLSSYEVPSPKEATLNPMISP